MWTMFKVFIEFVTVLLLFYVLFLGPLGMCDLSSLTRVKPVPLALEKQCLNNRTTSPRHPPPTPVLGKSLIRAFERTSGTAELSKFEYYPSK